MAAGSATSRALVGRTTSAVSRSSTRSRKVSPAAARPGWPAKQRRAPRIVVTSRAFEVGRDMSVRRQALLAAFFSLALGRGTSAQVFVGFGDSITAGFNSGYGGYLSVYDTYNGWELPAASVVNQG